MAFRDDLRGLLNPRRRANGEALSAGKGRPIVSATGDSVGSHLPAGAAGIASPLTETAPAATADVYTVESSDGIFTWEYPQVTHWTDANGNDVEFENADYSPSS